jgi:hypothetical protein
MRRKMWRNNSRAGWKKGEKGEGELEPLIVVFLIRWFFFTTIILFCNNSKNHLAYNVDHHLSCSDCTRVVVLPSDC